MKALLKRLFADRSYSVKAASTLLAATALLSNGLGLLRNILFYKYIPLSQLDIYAVSFRIPDFLLNLIIYGAVVNAFVPIVTELITHKKKEEAWQVTNQLLSWLTILFVGLGIVLWVAMPYAMLIIAGGFDQDRFNTAVQLSRIMLIQPLFFAWSLTVGGLLNSTRRFTSYALAPLIYNIFLICGGLLAPHFGIISVTYAVVLGAAMHFLIQFWELHRSGFRFQLDFRFTERVREIVVLMLPRSLSQGMAQLVLIVYATLATYLQQGSLAVFSGMNDLQTTPTVIITNSLAVAFFPVIASYVAETNWESMNNLITKVVRVCLYVLIPATILAFVLRAQVVRLYFGMGNATWEETQLAISTFSWFLLGIVPGSLVIIFSRIFYAFKNTWTPMYVSIFSGLISITIAVLGITKFDGDVTTLALANSILVIVQCILFLTLLHRDQRVTLSIGSIFPFILSYTFGSTLVALTTWATLQIVDRIYRFTDFISTHLVIGLFIQLICAGMVGVATYLIYSKAVHKEELQWLLKRRFTNNR